MKVLFLLKIKVKKISLIHENWIKIFLSRERRKKIEERKKGDALCKI